MHICTMRGAFSVILLLATEALEDDGHVDWASARLAEDDECGSVGGAGTEDGRAKCAVSALQLRAAAVVREADPTTNDTDVAKNIGMRPMGNLDDDTELEAESVWEPDRIQHYALDCFYACNGPGMCEDFCGKGNACCRYMRSGDPPECAGVSFWPVVHCHTCVHSPLAQQQAEATMTTTTVAPPPVMPQPQPGWPTNPTNPTSPTGPTRPTSPPPPAQTGPGTPFDDPRLYKRSTAPLMEFFMYRVQTDENYDPMNQNLANAAGALWYLHNEIVIHPGLQRSGTHFSNAKTRIERFRVQVRATEPVYALGMHFGVVNTFDLTKCTGPFNCDNFRKFGYAVGCESWKVPSDFPHGQWNQANHYPGATWYSLPGPCWSKALHQKDLGCAKLEPGGACPGGVIPTGQGNCTYKYEKLGELTIDELEGLESPDTFVKNGGREYDVATDKGYLMSFWDGKNDVAKNRWRIERMKLLFRQKFPNQPELVEFPCDFNKFRFYPEHHLR